MYYNNLIIGLIMYHVELLKMDLIILYLLLNLHLSIFIIYVYCTFDRPYT